MMGERSRFPLRPILRVLALCAVLGSIAVVSASAAPDRSDGLASTKFEALGMAGASEALRAGTMHASDSDDDIDGALHLTDFKPLASGSRSDSIHYYSDSDDVFWIYLEAGASVDFDLTCQGGSDVDLYLWGPGTVTVDNPDGLVASDVGNVYPKQVSYLVPTSGIYYVNPYALSGSGTYTLSWDVMSSPNDDIPGISMPSSRFEGFVDAYSDWMDVYKVYLGKNDSITVKTAGQALYSSSDFDIDVYLYKPGARSIEDDELTAAESEGASERLVRRLPSSGTYYVGVYCPKGWGYYDLEWSTGRAPVPRIAKSQSGSVYTLRRHSGVVFWTYSATLRRPSGTRLSGKTVRLQRSKNGSSWSTVATLKTNSNGRVSRRLAFTSRGTTYWRWYSPADHLYNSKTASRTRVIVR